MKYFSFKIDHWDEIVLGSMALLMLGLLILCVVLAIMSATSSLGHAIEPISGNSGIEGFNLQGAQSLGFDNSQ